MKRSPLTSPYVLFPATLAFVFALWLGYPWFTRSVNDSLKSLDDLGKFGDLFGGLNALFAGCAFAALVVTFWQQQAGLREQWTHFQATLKQLREDAQESKRQAFEAMFFNWLSLAMQTRDRVMFDKRVGILAVTDLIGDVYRQYLTNARIRARQPAAVQGKEEIFAAIQWSEDKTAEIEDVLELVHRCDRWSSGSIYPYTLNVRKLIEFVCESPVLIDRNSYLRIIVAQLGKSELRYWFYLLLTPKYAGLKKVFEEHGLFSELDVDELIIPQHSECYASSAFGICGWSSAA